MDSSHIVWASPIQAPVPTLILLTCESHPAAQTGASVPVLAACGPRVLWPSSAAQGSIQV